MSIETIKAAVSMAVVVLVDVAAALGVDIDGDVAANAVYIVVAVVATVYGCWHNHNFTQAAQEAQQLLDKLKSGDADDDDDDEGDTDC